MNLYQKWIGFISLPKEDRQNFLEALHPEIARGFELIVAIASSEFKQKLSKEIEADTMEHLEISLSYLVYAGYFLQMIEAGVNIIDEDFLNSEKSALTGEHLIQILEDHKFTTSQKVEDFLSGVSVEIFGYIQILKNSYIDRILILDTYLNDKPYSVLSLVEQYFTWTQLMGYKLAQIELKLNQKQF